VELLDSPIRGYSWGSRTAIAAIQGRPTPSSAPEAELWMGAHPDSPSTVVSSGATLTDAVAARPEALLGPVVYARFGARLPFMLKVLAADSPLSLQAHPDAETAARRYADEAGRPAAERNYTDPYAKPELFVATDDLDTLCGFRGPDQAAVDFAALGVPALDPVLDVLRSPAPAADRLRAAVGALLRWPAGDRADVVSAVVVAARRLGFDHVADLGERFPGDLGTVVALLLNHVRLAPDEAIWMPAGNLHAYLRGTGMELLASSDNVLRGGLTTKKVDVAELMSVLRFEVLADPVVKPVALGPGVLTWPVPTDEFSLVKTTTSADLEPAGPRIVFCYSGFVTVDDGEPVALAAGQAAFGAAGRPMSIRGTGVAYTASTGQMP
jgi:mannose-6-phosphate isomerase